MATANLNLEVGWRAGVNAARQAFKPALDALLEAVLLLRRCPGSSSRQIDTPFAAIFQVSSDVSGRRHLRLTCAFFARFGALLLPRENTPPDITGVQL